jgi:hypothetical protein
VGHPGVTLCCLKSISQFRQPDPRVETFLFNIIFIKKIRINRDARTVRG